MPPGENRGAVADCPTEEIHRFAIQVTLCPAMLGWFVIEVGGHDVYMRDTELYRQLLGLTEPWTVARVELSVATGRVDVRVEHGRGCRFGCPRCQRQLAVRDHTEQRQWRHLDSCQFLTFLHARTPRVDCPEHGVVQIALPWAEPWTRFTTLFERLAIDVLKECDVSGAARLLRLSWDEVWHLMDRAVARGLAATPLRVPAHVGVDEKAAGKGHDYITVVSDIDAATVEYISDERRQTSLDAYFTRFSAEQREGMSVPHHPARQRTRH